MPTYEYVCTKGHRFEAFQSIKDAPLTRCLKCNSPVSRVINGGLGVIFKGSGFYTTDYKKSSALAGANGNTHKEKEKSAESTAAKTLEKPKETTGGTSEK